MGLLKDCKDNFKTENLYEVLGVSKSADSRELKRAYYKTSLKVHPDRVPKIKQEIATIKFQILGKVYSILSDDDKRAIYDETGKVDDDEFSEEKDWYQYWRLLYKKINSADIMNFEEKYKGSDEELKDLKQAYVDGKGSMDFILETVLCTTYEDEERFRDIISRWIEDEEVEDFPSFSQETVKQKNARKRKYEREARQAAEASKAASTQVQKRSSLEDLIRQKNDSRQAAAESFLDGLAAKYGAGDAKKKKKKQKR